MNARRALAGMVVGLAALAAVVPPTRAHATSDPNTWTQLHPPTSPEARDSGSAAYDGHEVVIFGGYDSSTHAVFGDTWTWDGRTWTQRHPTTSPPARVGGHMAWDGRQVVLFSGSRTGAYGSNLLSDTWTWDGANWTQRQPTMSPPQRLGGMIAYDGTGAVLYGGQDQNGNYLGDTWTWDGSNWMQRILLQTPGTRRGAEACYDPLRHVVVMTGGTNGSVINEDVWYWDGSTWAQELAGGVASIGGGLAFDGVTDVLLPGGGTTWTWSGGGWDQQHPPVMPSQAYGLMIWDQGHRNAVLFGGIRYVNNYTSYVSVNDTWIWGSAGAAPGSSPTPTARPTARPTANPQSTRPTPTPTSTQATATTSSPMDAPSAAPSANPSLNAGNVGGHGGSGHGSGGLPAPVLIGGGLALLLGLGGVYLAAGRTKRWRGIPALRRWTSAGR